MVMGKKKPIRRYDGSLTAEQVANGMNMAARNAGRLAEDAKRLFDVGSYPTACSLAVLAIEEAGKLSVLRGIAAAPDAATLKARWKEYRSHRSKNAMWIIADLAAKGAKTLSELRQIYDPDSDHPDVLDVVKQLGFYTDCYGNAHWSEPTEVIDEKLAETILSVAQVLVPKRATSTREIELWVHHVGDRWGAPEMLQGSVEFHRAMADEGMSEHSIEEVEAFYGIASGNAQK